MTHALDRYSALTFSSSSISESFLSIARLSRFSDSDIEFLPVCYKNHFINATHLVGFFQVTFQIQVSI